MSIVFNVNVSVYNRNLTHYIDVICIHYFFTYQAVNRILTYHALLYIYYGGILARHYRRETNPYDPPIGTVLDFLVTLHDKGLKYSTLNTAKSAISAVILPTNNHTIGTHALVSRFMSGIYKSNPLTPRYHTTWKVQTVLTYL